MASGFSDLSEIRGRGGARSDFGAYNKPPKIDLLNEQPRRESLIEQQLTTSITRPPNSTQNVTYQTQQVTTRYTNTSALGAGQRSQEIPVSSLTYGPSSQTGTSYGYGNYSNSQPGPSTSARQSDPITVPPASISRPSFPSLDDVEAELAKKEAKLRSEMAYMNLYQHNPWARPPQVREPRREPPPRELRRSDQRWIKECPQPSPSSRPVSRASSSNTEVDLLEKTAQLMKEVDEIERKPMQKQQILIEAGTSPRELSPGYSDARPTSTHTALIKVPNREPDNKSPLPFAYDNFSTLGIRGNIASVGAAEPEKPYPPIFPTIRRTPSPGPSRYNARGH